MHERRLTAEELARTRFATSPLWETVASLRALRSPTSGAHAAWVGPTRERVRSAGLDLHRLLTLVPPTGYLADFLTPAPTERYGRFDRELARVARTGAESLRRDLAFLRTYATTEATVVIDEALTGPDDFLAAVVDDLQRYWDLTVSHVWERLEGLAEADIAWRLEQMAAGGAHAVLDTLHPRVGMDGGDLVVHDYCGTEPPSTRGGVVLVPCAFAWPHLLFLEEEGAASTLSYSPRGVGNLWREAPSLEHDPLADLLGRTRAAALHLLDLPMTTGQLACHLDIAPATGSEHLKVLLRSGLVVADRRGRRVLYSRSPLGSSLTGGQGA